MPAARPKPPHAEADDAAAPAAVAAAVPASADACPAAAYAAPAAPVQIVVDIDEGFEDDEFPGEYPFWYGGASGEQHMLGGSLDGGDDDDGAGGVFAAHARRHGGGEGDGDDDEYEAGSLRRAGHAARSAAMAVPGATTATTTSAAAAVPTDARRASASVATAHSPGKAFFPLDTFMSRRLSVDRRAADPAGRRGSFHDQDSVLHYFVATSQSEQLLDQYISGIIKAFLDEPTPIFAASVPNTLNDAGGSRFGGLRIPAGSSPSPADVGAYLQHLKTHVVDRSTRTGSSRMIGHMTTALPFFHRPLARLLAALNQNVVKIETASTFTHLERQTLAMLHKAFFSHDDAFYAQHAYSPECALGVMASGGTVANITAMWIARNKALAASPAVGSKGVDKEGLVSSMAKHGFKRAVIVGSALMHYSFKKAADLIGIGEEGLCLIPTDDAFRMRTDLLRAKIEELVAERVLVVAIVGIAGTTETGSIDPLADIAAIAGKHGIHFHVDAAWGGPLIFSLEHSGKLAGISLADTITVDGHKQLYTPMGLGILLTRSPTLATFIRKTANYVIRTDSPDLGKFTLEGSRPANALYLHASLSLLGTEGLGVLVTRSSTLVRQMYVRLESHPSRCFQVLHEPMSNLLLYRFVPAHLRDRIAAGAYDPNDEDEAAMSELTRRIQIRQASWATGDGGSGAQQQQQQQQQQQHGVPASTAAAASASGRPPPAPAPAASRGSVSVSAESAAAAPGFVSRTRVLFRGHQVDAFRVVVANPLTTWQDIEGVIADQLEIGGEVDQQMQRERMARRLRAMFPVPASAGGGGGGSDWWAGWPFDL